MRKILILLVMTTASFCGHASNMKTYGFTSDFVDCVKRHSAESDNYVRHGKSQSSLMNGSGISGEPLNSSYWAYMNCLSASNSGTSNESLSIGRTCRQMSISSPYGTLNIPPGIEGKKIGISGHFFKCSSGNWVSTSGAITNPGGGEISPEPPENNASCSTETITLGGCYFSLDGTTHGQTSSDKYGPFWGDSDAQAEGEYLAYCRNGNYELVNSSCEPVSCQDGEKVEWGGIGPKGEGVLCSGSVSYNGQVEHNKADPVYYKSLIMARLGTKIISGKASFICKKNKWVLSEGESPTCSLKASAALDCGSKTTNGEKLYYCE